MGLKTARGAYTAIIIAWNTVAFSLLIPEVSEWLQLLCWRRFESAACSHFCGLDVSYRVALVNICFHSLLAFATIDIDCCSEFASSWHTSCWLLKIPIFIAINIFVFVIPFNGIAFTVLYYICLFGSAIFILIMFVLTLDFCHAWKILWMRNAHERSEEPTCYVCTWLFLIHLITSLLYAASFDIILAFFFFNPISNCGTTICFLSINLFLCLVAIAISCHSSLKETKASSQIVISSVIFYVSFISWLALSDPENEYCNMFGTAFSGSQRKVPTSFKSIFCCIMAVDCIIFLSLRNESVSFTYSLIYLDKQTDEKRFFGFSRYHLTFVFASCYILMAMTNWYSPIDEDTMDWDRGRRVKLIDLEEYNWVRFIVLCLISSCLPLVYIGLLTYRICHHYVTSNPFKRWKRKESKQQQQQKQIEMDDELCVHISFAEAVKKLKKSQVSQTMTRPTQDVEFVMVPCFYISEKRLYFWHFPRDISQSYHGGRNGSNACTIIALIIGRLFARSEIFTPPFGYLTETWINLYTTSIVEGNALYDSILKDFGVLDLSIEEAAEHFGAKLNIARIGNPLPVSFQSDIETVTIAFQLRRFVSLRKKQVVLFIHRFRTGSFLIYPDGSILFSDSHSYGEEGALLVWAAGQNVDILVDFLMNVLGSNQNKLATLTEIEYESRHHLLKNSSQKNSDF